METDNSELNYDQVYNQVRSQVWDRVRGQVWDQVGSQIRNQIEYERELMKRGIGPISIRKGMTDDKKL